MGAMSQAEQVARSTERLFVDWEAFQADKLKAARMSGHRYYIAPARSWWDDCCGRQICDESLAPYPELSLVAPYLAAIQRGITQAPAVDHPYLLDRRPPLYFDGPIASSDDLVYVDLRAAYFSIYTRTTLDVFYDGQGPPRRGVVPFTDTDELGKFKLARNALLGLQHRRNRHGIDFGQHFTEIVPPHRRRPDLWGLVMDALEVVAWSARDAGACYYHTDGAIFAHHDLAEDWIATVAERYRLTATIRASGPGNVLGLGRFTIGGATAGRDTAPGHRVDTMVRAPHDLSDAITEWLRWS